LPSLPASIEAPTSLTILPTVCVCVCVCVCGCFGASDVCVHCVKCVRANVQGAGERV
jgi:hypothetical protein